jgi:two-component system cell cycle sensor histidine kinase/response regulator CckA
VRARILVVDDDESVRSVAERVLADAGFDVLCASSAGSALELLQAREIDIVVTDVVMPGMDGFTLGAQIAVFRPHTRVVYMSGRLPAHENTAGNVLEKPFTPAGLVHAVESVLAPPV